MPEHNKLFSSTSQTNSKTLKGLLFFLLVATPFVAATEYIWPKSIIIFAGGIIVLGIATTFLKSKKIEFTNTLINPLAFIFFAISVLTLTPLPHFILKFISPHTYFLYKDYLPLYQTTQLFSSPRPLALAPYKTLMSLSIIFVYAAIFFCLINKLDRFRLRISIAKVIVAIGTAIACWGLFDLAIGNEKLFWFKEVVSGDPTGPFINTIHFAHFLALCIPLSLGMWLSGIDFTIAKEGYSKIKTFIRNAIRFLKQSLLYLFPALIMIFALFKALSRGAMLSLCVSLLVFICLLLAKKKTRIKALLLIGIVFLSGFLIANLDQGDIKSRITTLKTPMVTDSAKTRTTIWKDSFQIFKDFPFFGTGLNTYQDIFPKYKSIYGSGKMVFTHAENDYVETLSEVGFLGAICIIFILIIFLRNVFYNYKLQDEPFKIALLAGGIASFFAIFFSALTDFVFRIPAISLIFLFICFIIWPRVKGKTTKVLYLQNNRKGFVFIFSVLFCIVLFLLIFSGKLLIGQVFFYKFVHSGSDFKLKRNYIEKACLFDGMNDGYRYRLGKLYFETQVPTTEEIDYTIKAKKNFDKAINLVPSNWRYHFYSGSAELILANLGVGDFSVATAQKLFDQALELNPTEYDIYEYLGWYYLSLQPQRALGYYRRLLVLRPWKLSAVLNKIWRVNNNPWFLRQAVPDDPGLLEQYEKFLKSKGVK